MRHVRRLRCARHSTRPTAKKRARLPGTAACATARRPTRCSPNSRTVARVTSRRADCLCCLLCRLHGFFHFLHCRRVRATPPRVDADPCVLRRRTPHSRHRHSHLYRAPPQLSPVESAGESGGGGGDAEVDEERELLAAQRPHGKSPSVGWLVRAVRNSSAHRFEELARRTGRAAAQIHEFVDDCRLSARGLRPARRRTDTPTRALSTFLIWSLRRAPRPQFWTPALLGAFERSDARLCAVSAASFSPVLLRLPPARVLR